MGLTGTENAVLQLSVEAAENSEHRHAAASYLSAWIRCGSCLSRPAHPAAARACRGEGARFGPKYAWLLHPTRLVLSQVVAQG